MKYFYKKPNKYVASAYFVCYNIHKVETVIKWFDKTNKKLRFLLDEGDQVYYYKDLETIGISCEYHHNLKKSLAHNLVFPTYAQGRQFGALVFV